MIDNKLREILLNHHVNMKSTTKRVGDISGEAIAEIHQAFADEGYLPTINFKELDKKVQDNIIRLRFDAEVMTGQEWLTKFKRALDEYDRTELDTKSGPVDFMAIPIVEEAARRAAGLDSKEQQA